MNIQYSHASPLKRWVFLAIISLGLLLLGLDNSILYTALPELDRQLNTTGIQELWIINAYPLLMSGLLLGTGTLGDKVGHRLMFLVGLALFTLASLAAAFAPTAWILVAARAFLGIGAATMMPATLALIRQTFRQEREFNLAIGIWGSVATIGAAAGPLVGGFLLEHFWWGSIFLINVPIGIFALIATIFVAPVNMADPSRKWDALSSFYALFTLIGAVMIIKAAASPELPNSVLLSSIFLLLLFGTLFAWRQRRSENPLLDIEIFKDPIFSGGVLAAGGAMMVMLGTELMTSQRFQLASGFSPLETGSLVAISALSAIPASIIGGAILHRVGFRTLITGGFLISAAGVILLALTLLPGHEISKFSMLAMAVLGAGAGFIMSVSSTAIMGSAPLSKAGMASGIEEVSYEIGHLLTVAITGSLLPLFYIQAGGTAEKYGSHLVEPQIFDTAYSNILWVLTGCALLFAALTAWCFRGNPRSGSYASV
ncbi:Antiseptic resistance protein [Corynebacterium caspium DSM 44850]|nr:MFS transporter [Corynebacterium caspium]WKD58724.1 Antiseptic resistance protein [Corynebacterium caspium DSM 44850]